MFKSTQLRRLITEQPRYFTSVRGVTYSLTYLLTPRCRVLLEQLTGLQLVKKFPAFHGTRRFITALTSVRGITRIIFIYNPHSVSYSMDPGFASLEDKPVGMARICNNVYTTTTTTHTHTHTHTHIRLRDLILN